MTWGRNQARKPSEQLHRIHQKVCVVGATRNLHFVRDSSVLGPAQPLQTQRVAQHVAAQPLAAVGIALLDGDPRMHVPAFMLARPKAAAALAEARVIGVGLVGNATRIDMSELAEPQAHLRAGLQRLRLASVVVIVRLFA